MNWGTRSVIGWAMSKRINKQLVCDALSKALWRQGFPKGVIMHTDRGSQYCSNKYQKMLKSHGLLCSMSRKGNCWDNAVAESFFKTLKVELVYQTTYKTREQAQQDIFEYMGAFPFCGYLCCDLNSPVICHFFKVRPAASLVK